MNMKILSKVLIGLVGLVGGALIERGVSGYADDINEMRRKPEDDAPEDDATEAMAEAETEAPAEDATADAEENDE
jgi:hypothetical protein